MLVEKLKVDLKEELEKVLNRSFAEIYVDWNLDRKSAKDLWTGILIKVHSTSSWYKKAGLNEASPMRRYVHEK